MRARVLSPVLLALTVALAGCIDLQVFPAHIPDESLAPGWALDASQSQSGTIGQEPIVRAHYHVNAYRDAGSGLRTNPEGPGAALIVSVPDAPLVDEQAEVQKRIDALVKENGVHLTPRPDGSGSVNGLQVTFKLYDAVVPISGGVRADGYAIDIPYKCPVNGQWVRVFGYAATEVAALGGANLATWRELAGGAELSGGTLGGMLTAVKCA